jgi:hypothetical protein
MKIILVSGGSILGEIFGLYRIYDRLKVFQTIPHLWMRHISRLGIRLSRGGTKKTIPQALCYGATRGY